MRLAILSDIHANLSAYKSVINSINTQYQIDAYVLLGDLVNYGMRPNDIIEELKLIDDKIIVSLWGNHEKALFDDSLEKFSSDRGRESLLYTKKILSDKSWDYLNFKMEKSGMCTLCIDDKRILFVHGSVSDPFWGKMSSVEVQCALYKDFDMVISGHSHVPDVRNIFYNSDNSNYRNKKRTVFINPGSVGQPRNHSPFACYAFVDTSNNTIHLNSVEYDVDFEQSLYDGELDDFYKKRLLLGI